MENVLPEKKIKEVNVYPLSKGKRVILYLSDFFLAFIFAITLYTLAVSPLATIIMGMEAKATEYDNNIALRDSVLYGNELLFQKDETAVFSTDMEYTYTLYLGYLVGDSEHLSGNYEVFYNYFVDIKEDVEAYISFYEGLDPEGTYFDITDTSVSLKENRIDEFMPYYRDGDTPSEAAQDDYASFQSNIFLSGYNLLINDIMENDLTYEWISYVESQNAVGRYITLSEYFTSVCAEISYLLGSMIVYLIFPLINKNRKTLSMLVLRRYRVDARTLNNEKLRKVPLLFLYQFALANWGTFFVPLGSVGFNELFSLPLLLPLSLVSLAIAIGSLFMLLFDDFNRDLLDKLTYSVVIDEDELDKIYEAKGYKDL